MLVPEDFDVAIALAFGGTEPIYPSLSLEAAHTEVDDKFDCFSIKLWDPAWLQETDFGRTLYITDALTGALGWNPTAFSVRHNTYNQNLRAGMLLSALHMSGGACAGYCSGRVMLRPEHIPITMDRHKSIDPLNKIFWRVSVGQPKIMVDGAFIAQDSYDGEKDKNFALNDTRYSHGRTAQKLTQLYNVIAIQIPAFERNRQLMALLYGLIKLRENPYYKPSEDLITRARQNLKKFELRTSQKNKQQRVCRKLPLTFGI